MRAAVIQYRVKPGDIKGNCQKAEYFLREARAKGAQIALLPELWNCGYKLDDLPVLAENLKNSPSLKLLQALSAELGLFILGGSIAEVRDGKYYNTALAIDEKGNLVEKYRKTHLFRLGLEEHLHFSAGNQWAFAQLPQIKIGLTVCYDLRFPELIRNLALRGARLITVPAQWPESRIENMLIMLRSRAIENQSFVLSANNTGYDEINDLQYCGNSLIVSPFGDILADGGREEGVSLADLDFELIEKAGTINVFNERRRLIDEIDDNLI